MYVYIIVCTILFDFFNSILYKFAGNTWFSCVFQNMKVFLNIPVNVNIYIFTFK